MMVRLGDICEIQSGGTPARSNCNYWEGGTIPWVKISDIKGKHLNKTEEFITESGLRSSSAKIFPKGTILYTIFATLGETCILDIDAATNQAIAGLTIKSNNISQKYLYYYLLSLKSTVNNLGRGVAQNNINMGILRNISVPLPPFDEQCHIAIVLDKVSVLLTKCRQQLDKLDELVKSRFIEMFGQGSYPRHALIELITEGAGLSYGIVQPGDDGTGDMGVLRPVDLVDGGISTAAIKYIDRSIGDGFKKTELTGDELLITVRGTTGITALTDVRFKNMNVTRGIAVIRYDRNKINPAYLNAYLNTDESQRYIREHTRGATLQQINLADLRTLEILMPSRILQEKFAAFVAQTDKSKLAIQKSLEKLEILKKSLMQKYFG